MLRDVTHNVTDGLLGFATATGDGLHIKIGASPVKSDKPITITGSMNAAGIRDRLGLSPLADAAMTSVQFGAARIFCIPVSASTEGTIGEIVKSGSGNGSVAVEGSPANAFAVVVRITGRGGLNTAAFSYSINGGYSYSDELTVPVSGSYELEGTGLTLTFTEAEGEDASGSFLVDDSYTFQTTAPSMTNGDVLAAIDKIKGFNQEFEFIHIVGESTLALWQAVSAAQKELMNTHHKPAFFLMEAAYPTQKTNAGGMVELSLSMGATHPVQEAGDLTDWALQMEADRKKIRNTDIQVCAAWGRLVMLDGVTQTVNLAALAAGLYAKAPVQTSIGKTRTEAGFAIEQTTLLELFPSCLDNSIIQLLDEAGYLTFREYDGLEYFYVYHTKMMCPDGSDYRYAEDVRVRNKIIRETRKEGLLLLNDDIDLEDVQGELEAKAKFMGTPLERMKDDKEISAYEITVPAGQEETILEDETMYVTVRYKSRGYIREIVVDLGRAPATT